MDTRQHNPYLAGYFGEVGKKESQEAGWRGQSLNLILKGEFNANDKSGEGFPDRGHSVCKGQEVGPK